MKEVMEETEKAKEIVKKYLKQNALLTPELLYEIREKEQHPEKEYTQTNIQVIFSHKEKPAKLEVEDFISYFNKRYHDIRKILQNRSELKDLTSINRLQDRKK